MKGNILDLPGELCDRDQWVVYKKGDKSPWNARPGKDSKFRHAKTDDPSTWSSFTAARQAVDYHGNEGIIGIGFVFKEEDPYCGIDLDKVIDDGVIAPEAQAIIDRLDSYTEVSQSGKGIHIIVRGEKPTSRCREANVEIYDKKRYFIITGDLREGRKTIEDRQEALSWLCEETFGKEEEAEAGTLAVDVALSVDAEPPEDKLKELLEDSELKKVWEHGARLKSLSDYDWRLTMAAIEAGWEDQEIADLIIAFRRQHGKAEDLAKALRKDYIPNTIAKAKSSGVLKLLPFEFSKMLQYGVNTTVTEYSIESESGDRIRMGSTEALLSPRRAKARFYDHGYKLSKAAMKRWDEITMEMRKSLELMDTVSREDSARSWLNDWVATRVSMPKIVEEEDIGRIFGEGASQSIAVDEKGRVYLRLSDLTRYVRVHTGLPGVSAQTVANDLVDLGFKKHKFSMTKGKKRYQPNLWFSPIGFIKEAESGG